ncbi:carbon-nitrogen hydrolase [Xylariales sp. PMI_506]|nr:carbon-nitrogen hydrolase [Xylariales sp. PMI_506]
MPFPKVRLATASPPSLSTIPETLSALHQVASRAAAGGADILLLPEAYLGAYPRGSDFGCKIGDRTAEGRDEFLEYFKRAADLGDTVGDGAGAGDAWIKNQLPGNAAEVEQNAGNGGARPARAVRGDGTREELEKIAKETGVFIVTGLIEKAGGSLYCSVVYVCPKLGVIGKRRKVQPTGTERLIWAQGSPATLKAVSTVIKGVRINLAAAICWESYMPLLRQALYSQNINLYLAPTADGREAWMGLMRTVAIEGRCFVVSSNMCVRGSNQSSNGTTKKVTAASSGDSVPARQGSRRRSSCFTEEGFEIALPCASDAPHPNATAISSRTGSASGSVKTRSRRRSVFDGDGHEIVLCGDKETTTAVIDEEEGEMNAPAGVPTNARQLKNQGKFSAVKTSTDFISRGGSSIISPSGDILAGPQWEDDEGIIYADVDFEDCIRGRLDLDAAGSYSRNDSFKFSVQGLDLDPLPY